MALYYLQSLIGVGHPPEELIDHNVRIDYGKLRHLIQIDRRLLESSPSPGEADLALNGNFSHLRQIPEQGERVSPIQTSQLQGGDP